MKNFIVLVVAVLMFSCSNQPEKINNDSAPEEKIVEVIKDTLLDNLNVKIREDINNPDLYIQRSKLFREANDLDAAYSDLLRANQIDSNRIATKLAMADYHMSQGKMALALENLKRALIIDPTVAETYVKLSELYLIGRNNKESLKYADLAVKYDMFNAKAYYFKGYNFLELGDTVKAISSYQTAVEQDPNYYEAYIELGLLFALQDNPLAIDYYNNALKIRPDDRNALYSRGMFEQEHEMYNEAIQTYFQATKQFPDFKEAHFNLGYVHMYYLRLYREATVYFTNAIEVDPLYYQAYYNRGYSFELLGDIGNAAIDYRNALKLKPDYTLAANGLSRVTSN